MTRNAANNAVLAAVRSGEPDVVLVLLSQTLRDAAGVGRRNGWVPGDSGQRPVTGNNQRAVGRAVPVNEIDDDLAAARHGECRAATGVPIEIERAAGGAGCPRDQREGDSPARRVILHPLGIDGNGPDGVHVPRLAPCGARDSEGEQQDGGRGRSHGVLLLFSRLQAPPRAPGAGALHSPGNEPAGNEVVTT